MLGQRSPELTLLLRYALISRSDVPSTVDAGLRDGIVQWEELMRLASFHRLLGPLHSHLRRPELAPMVPTDVSRRLEDTYYRETARNLYLQAQLGVVAQALAGAGITIGLLKGAALAPIVYEDLGLRPMHDLDILVARDQVDCATEMLEAMGYRSPLYSCCRPGRSPHSHGKPTLVGHDGLVAVDIHTWPAGDRNMAGWRARSGVRATAGTPEPLVPPMEDLAFYLCWNAFNDRRRTSGQALGQLADVAEVLIHAEDFDWDLLIREARLHKREVPVGVPLLAARVLFDSAVPQSVVDDLLPDGVANPSLRHFVRSSLADRDPAPLHWLAPSRHPLEVLFPSRGYLEQRYGGPVGRGRALRLYGRRASQAIAMLAGAVRSPST